MSDASALTNLLPFIAYPQKGYSESAKFVDDEMEKIGQRFQESYELGMIGKGVLGELYQVFLDCREMGWDGYKAKPVSIESYLLARRFIQAIAPSIEAPSIGAEPDGQITAEWYRNPRWVLSISFDPESKIHYAALFGQNRTYGTESFFDEIPKNIIDLIYRTFSG